MAQERRVFFCLICLVVLPLILYTVPPVSQVARSLCDRRRDAYLYPSTLLRCAHVTGINVVSGAYVSPVASRARHLSSSWRPPRALGAPATPRHATGWAGGQCGAARHVAVLLPVATKRVCAHDASRLTPAVRHHHTHTQQESRFKDGRPAAVQVWARAESSLRLNRN